MRRFAWACILLLVVLAPAFAVDDYRTRIAVAPMENRTQEARFDSVCRTVTETVALVFRLMGRYLVVESDDDPALLSVDTSSDAALANFAESSKYDEVLLGSASKDDAGVLTFKLSLFSRADGKIKYEATSTASSILDVFDAADEITVGLLSQVSNIHIGFGVIEVKTSSGKGAYAVYLNDAKIRNPKTMLGKVLNGTYTITIHQNRLLGDTEIFRKEIKVFEDQTTAVSFSIPVATPEEKAFVEAQKAKLLSTPPDQVQTLLKNIADFQAKTGSIDYDDTLNGVQSKTITDAGAKALDMLRAATKTDDDIFYAKKPDFKAAQSGYGDLAKMVSDSFDFQLLEPGDQPVFSAPTAVQVAPDGTVYVLDSAGQVQLRAAGDGKTLGATLPVHDADATANPGQIACDPASHAYYIPADAAEITELDKNLQAVKTITIPGYTPAGGALMAAISEDGLIYLLGGSQVIVFAPGGQRETDVEKAIQAGLDQGGTVDGVFFDGNGLLNVLDDATRTVRRFDANGALLSTASLSGVIAGSAAAVDSLGYFYVTNATEHRIEKYSPRGELITTFGRYGPELGQFAAPQSVAITRSGTIYVGDTYNNRVQILTPTTTPILVADVARYGMTLTEREVTAEKAQKRIELTLGNIRSRDVTAPLAAGGGVLAAGAALLAVSSYFHVQAETSYNSYIAATDPALVGSLHDQVTTSSLVSSLTSFGSELSLVGAVALMTSAVLTGIKNAGAEAETVSQIQAFSMDTEYELDRSKYRALSSAESIGFWTGVLPPLIGAVTLFTLPEIPVSTGYLAQIVAAATVLMPPVFSNLYAGRLDDGLAVMSLCADALVAVSAGLYLGGAPTRTPTDLGGSLQAQNAALYATLNTAWKQMQANVALYPLIAALGVRLAAGIYDMKTGWVEAKNTNLYRAIKKKNPAPEISLIPVENMQGLRLELTFRY
jgi:hypothetical protein